MWKYILKRLGYMLLTLLAVVSITFLLVHTIPGDPPDMSKIPPNACAFAARCQYATEECRCQRPPLEEIEPGHFCACFHKDQTDKERSELV